MNYELISVALAFACLFVILVAVVVIIMAWKTIKENNSLVARLNSANAAVARYMEALKECREWAARIRTNLDASEDARERLIQKCKTAGGMVAEGKRRLGRAERCIERLKVLARAQRDEINAPRMALQSLHPIREFKPTPLGVKGATNFAAALADVAAMGPENIFKQMENTMADPQAAAKVCAEKRSVPLPVTPTYVLNMQTGMLESEEAEVHVGDDGSVGICPVDVYEIKDRATEPVPAEQLSAICRTGQHGNVLMAGN